MKRVGLAGILLAAIVSWLCGAKDPPAATHQVKLNGHTFTLPAGFEIELVAGPPLVDRPIVADFDEEGRLYVADSSGSNEKVDIQLQKKPHRILRLEDTDGDGRFDRRTVYADRMMFPEGVMWLDGSVYVAAPPSIWKLTDTKGDGVADQRSEWFQGKTLTGCANDLHGPYAGPDGWVYWCKGAFAKQTYERPGKPPFVTRAAHIFRCRPDGTGIEPVMTGGMDNPVDVVFTPGGERIFTTTFFQHPGGGRRDGLVHAVYGGVYGKDHDPVYEHKWTGPGLMPVLTHLGPAAPCGLTRYESEAFGPAYRDNLFACCFNMQKVTRHVLVPDGATFWTKDEDFLVSDNRDFHPTDVIEDADGSLLVIDTGGWYKLCCPTSQLYKPDVLGAIYRVRRKGAPRSDDPRGLKLAWATLTPHDLAKLLGDPRPAVRRRAIQALGTKGAEAVAVIEGVLREAKSVEARRNAIWAATRIDQPAARAAVRSALADPDESVRQVALHSISLWRDSAALPSLQQLLNGAPPHNQRAAAEALGCIGDKSAVPALLAALGRPTDRVLEHSLTYALIEITDREGTAAGLASANLRTRRAALIALDQMDGGGLEPEAAAAELAAKDPALKEAAAWIVGRHPEWGAALAGLFRERLMAQGLTPAEGDELALQLARLAKAPAIQQLLIDRLNDSAAREPCRLALKAVGRSGLKQAPEAWATGLAHVMASGDDELVREAVAAARAVPLPKQGSRELTDQLLTLAGREKLSAGVRLAALAAVPGGLAEVKPPLFAFLTGHLNSDQPVALRTLAADVLAHARLTPDQLVALTKSFEVVGPLELDRLLEAFGQSTDDRVGLGLVASLKDSPARSGLRTQTLKPRLAKFSPGVQKEAEALYALLDADNAMQKARLEELLATLPTGEARRGQAVFNSAKAACSSCHAVGYLGGNVGPDLTSIGKIRNERDLLEAIVFPSASFVRGYEPMTVMTKGGKSYNGLLRKDAPDEILLVLGANQEVRLARAEIEAMEPSSVSVMPSGLDQQLSRQELADVVAFLKACK